MMKPRERCQERDGHGHWNSIDGQDKHFFKIMIGDFHERMIIPDRFVQHFRRESGQFVKLKSHNDHTFDVRVARNSKKLVLQSGWKEFVGAHDLKMGDFLVFRYDGNSQLKVLIFDPSGCQKVLAMKSSTRRGERREEPVEIKSSCSDPPMKSPQSESRQTRVQCSRQGNKIVDAILSSRSRTSGSTGYVSPSEVDLEAHFARSCIFTGGSFLAMTQVQKKKLKEIVGAVHSEIPFYVCAMRKSSLYGKSLSIEISKKYAEVYLPFKERMVTLQRHEKSWDVRCIVKAWKAKRFSTGWKQFARDNKLQLGDICVFELLKNERKYVMSVHVIRKS